MHNMTLFPMVSQPISLAALKNALSEERLQAYALQSDTDEFDAVARYIWNLALCASLQPALHALEITFRNHLYAHSDRVIRSRSRSQVSSLCWLDATPTMLEARELDSVRKAKEEINRTKRPVTPGRLISKLGFGFWISLCKRPYEQGRPSGPALWPAILDRSFLGLEKSNRNRAYIHRSLEPLRELRNRVSHHEPIWDHDLQIMHERVITVVAWMNAGVARVIRSESLLAAEVQRGCGAYRTVAQRIVQT